MVIHDSITAIIHIITYIIQHDGWENHQQNRIFLKKRGFCVISIWCNKLLSFCCNYPWTTVFIHWHILLPVCHSLWQLTQYSWWAANSQTCAVAPQNLYCTNFQSSAFQIAWRVKRGSASDFSGVPRTHFFKNEIAKSVLMILTALAIFLPISLHTRGWVHLQYISSAITFCFYNKASIFYL